MAELGNYDAVLVVSFGGPERREDVLPFLDNVLRGRNVPEARKLAVAEHYYKFGGRSPIGPATRAMVEALRAELDGRGPALPVYLGNRNWHPLLEDTLRTMAGAGVRRALAFATSAFGSYSSCRQYLEDIARARAGVGPTAPEVDKLGLFWDRPAFLDLWGDRLRAADVPADAALLFTAHSIPTAMAESSPYREQLQEAARRIATAAGHRDFTLAYSSRSGPPQQPWLEPSVEDVLDGLANRGVRRVVAVPLGFLSDHMEVVYDLDVEARKNAERLGLEWTRIETVGAHPGFAPFVVGLIRERIAGTAPLEIFCGPSCCARAHATIPRATDRAS